MELPLDLPADVAQAVSKVVKTQGFKTPRFLVEPGSGTRDGFCSQVYRIAISDEADPERAALNIIFKRSINVKGRLLRKMFATEDIMYNKVLPALEDVARLQEPLPWPKCYFGSVPAEPPFLVALGDLKPSNYRMPDRSQLLDAAHCYAVVSQLASLHGAGLALKHLRPDDFQRSSRLLENPWGHPDMKKDSTFFHRASLTAPDIVKDKFPEGSDVNKALVKLFEAFLDHNEAFFGPADGPGYTIIHSDCHANNLMFQYDKDGTVTGCRLIDFQTAFYGNPALDLCTLLLICVEKDVRDQHWDTLLREYHTKVQRTLRAAGCGDPDAIYPWELLQSLLASASVYALGMMPLYYNALFGDDEDVAAFKATMAAIADGSTTQTIAFRVTPRYKRCLEGLVQDMVAKGWLPSVADIDRILTAHAQQSC